MEVIIIHSFINCTLHINITLIINTHGTHVYGADGHTIVVEAN